MGHALTMEQWRTHARTIYSVRAEGKMPGRFGMTKSKSKVMIFKKTFINQCDLSLTRQVPRIFNSKTLKDHINNEQDLVT